MRGKPQEQTDFIAAIHLNATGYFVGAAYNLLRLARLEAKPC